MKKILIVDDEQNMQSVLSMLLEANGFKTICSANGKEALERLQQDNTIDLIISDLKMPEMDGIEFLNHLTTISKEIPVIIITAYGSISKAVEAMKKGAVDFITKPFNKDVFLNMIQKVFQMENLKRENTILKEALNVNHLIYKSTAMQNISEIIKKVAQVNTPILITGPSGTGKEVIAQTINTQCQGKHKVKPFVSINCPAVPESLLESELFGYKKGAFTGANKDFVGKIQMADGGTLFLDEVGDLPLSLQPKLLRLLETKTFEPLGSDRTHKINIRILCATNRDLKALIKEGVFREDLYYRINTIVIDIPPLKERKEDIPVLVEYFLNKYILEMGRGQKILSDPVKMAFQNYGWPGNVRELRNVIERVVVLSNNNVINLSDLPSEFTKQIEIFEEGNELQLIEKKLVQDALNEFQGNRSAAARKLGISRNVMRYRVKKYGLS